MSFMTALSSTASCLGTWHVSGAVRLRRSCQSRRAQARGPCGAAMLASVRRWDGSPSSPPIEKATVRFSMPKGRVRAPVTALRGQQVDSTGRVWYPVDGMHTYIYVYLGLSFCLVREVSRSATRRRKGAQMSTNDQAAQLADLKRPFEGAGVRGGGVYRTIRQAAV